MALIGKARGAGPGPVAGPYASVPPDSLWAAVSSMEGLPPDLGPRTGLRGELKELEAWFVDHGHLDKKWRDQFK